jgi:cytochrome c oxidase subunit 2
MPHFGDAWGRRTGPAATTRQTSRSGFSRRAERRGLRCVVFDIRAGGANVTPGGQFRSQRLSQGIFQRRSGDAPRGFSRRLRPLALAGTLGVLAVTLSGCSWSEVLGMGWPEGITPQAHVNRQLWIGSVIAALAVGVIVWGLIFWSSAFHRKKATDTELPRQFGYNMPLELVLTVTPFLIISVLFYFTVVVQEKMLHLEADPEVVIDVTSFQWNWKFGYQKVQFKDGTLKYDGADAAKKAAMVSKPEGKDSRGEELVGPVRGFNTEDRTYLNFDKVETVGTSTEIPVLVLPAGKRIEFTLASADVIHGFWVPEFLFKRDVMPDPAANHSVNVFQVAKIERTGAFVGRCTEMCGTYHSMMNFEVRVVQPNDFKAYLQQRITGKTNAQALQAIAQYPIAVTTHPFDTRRGEMARQASK